ncbi:hypothetical protein PR048_013555 [Dryococelus australis]|uniref:Uncharacterized protein n=1 Tax=Dryococelus australis TaxID=614101 RepID=A0ABQ9HSH8_9NEOP|nr:hypothetical protein PR048_013555 [Dryococelus australis]
MPVTLLEAQAMPGVRTKDWERLINPPAPTLCSPLWAEVSDCQIHPSPDVILVRCPNDKRRRLLRYVDLHRACYLERLCKRTFSIRHETYVCRMVLLGNEWWGFPLFTLLANPHADIVVVHSNPLVAYPHSVLLLLGFLAMHGKELQLKFRSIRDTFVSNHRAVPKKMSGDAAKNIQVYVYARQLDFLTKNPNHNETEDSFANNLEVEASTPDGDLHASPDSPPQFRVLPAPTIQTNTDHMSSRNFPPTMLGLGPDQNYLDFQQIYSPMQRHVSSLHNLLGSEYQQQIAQTRIQSTATPECKEKRKTPKKIRRPTESSGIIPTCENPARVDLEGVKATTASQVPIGTALRQSMQNVTLRNLGGEGSRQVPALAVIDRLLGYPRRVASCRLPRRRAHRTLHTCATANCRPTFARRCSSPKITQYLFPEPRAQGANEFTYIKENVTPLRFCGLTMLCDSNFRCFASPTHIVFQLAVSHSVEYEVEQSSHAARQLLARRRKGGSILVSLHNTGKDSDGSVEDVAAGAKESGIVGNGVLGTSAIDFFSCDGYITSSIYFQQCSTIISVWYCAIDFFSCYA